MPRLPPGHVTSIDGSAKKETTMHLSSIRKRHVVAALASACAVLGCGKQTVREVRNVTGGGPGEAWVVVEEFEQSKGGGAEANNRYRVYRCVPEGCALVHTITGVESVDESKSPKP
jgi:hypothetical protein